MGGLDDEVYHNQLKIAENYDFVHINFTGCLEYYLPLAEQYPEKLLITLINERSLLEGFDINIEKANKVIYSACGVTSVGYRMADTYRGVEYIPNGVDLDNDFRNHKRPIVGYCGTNRPNKNFQLLEKVCNDLKLKLHALTFEGVRVPHEDMWNEYRKMDVFVHPSLTEGASNPILEALAMNIPVICTDAGIVRREFIDLVTIIEPNYQSLYNALKKFDTRKIIAERFQWKDICKRYQLFYERCYARQQQMIRDKNVRN
jgi:glycosyltransferase involved in cell wall biosynthesis